MDRGFNEEESVWVYMVIDDRRELVMKVYEDVIKFPKGMPERFLNADVSFVFADKNPDRNTIAVELESDD